MSLPLRADSLAATDAQLRSYREALTGLEIFFRRDNEDATACFDRVAQAFFEETGFMRPGKSQPLEFTPSDEQRQVAYDYWVAKKLKTARALLATPS